jgi:multicomponent K+:H+ antiporter subunit D
MVSDPVSSISPAGALGWAHWVIVPVVGPLLLGALLLLLEKWRSTWVPALSLAGAVLWLAVAWALLGHADAGGISAYLLGNWAAPFGIALALDRLSALMLMLTALVGLGSLLYAMGGDAQRGPHFHTLLHIQLMGLNGAFLTADLFNLFVFFEVLLAASYGLLLHGEGPGRRERLKASVHYVVFNLTGSALFLIAVSLLYGLTGTLNMADLAVKLPQLGPENAALAQAAALMLLVVFAVKAALLPLYFWLPDTYASATAPVAALFAIMTKVGVYAVARSTTLFFGAGTGAVAGVASSFLPVLALGTLVLAAVGVLAATRLRGLVAYLVVASAGSLLLGIGLGSAGTLAASLFYLVNSTFVGALWFLLADRIVAARAGSDLLRPSPLAGHWGLLGAGFFLCAVAAAGVPPLAGFMGKALLLQAAGQTPWAVWVVALVLGSSLAMMVALGRAGSTLFWKSSQGASANHSPRPAAASAAGAGMHSGHKLAIALLVMALLACALLAGPLNRYTQAAAQQMLQPRQYISAVLGAKPVPSAHDVRKEMRERGDLQ